jgi:AcrR family transcriptional regulator
MQARGQATFERILDATARLLDEVGTEALTTNLIARTAAVNVATLYQYFPNKQAVLLALFKRHNETRADIGQRSIAGMARSPDWRRMVGKAIDGVAEARRSMGGAAALRLAMRSSPDLLEHDRSETQQIAAIIANELMDAGTRPDKSRLVARCTVEAISALLDLWSIDTSCSDDRIVEQAKDLAACYLAPYLDKRRGAGRAARRGR